MQQLVIINADYSYNSLFVSVMEKMKTEVNNEPPSSEYSGAQIECCYLQQIACYLQRRGYNVVGGLYKYITEVVCYSPTIDFEDDKEYLRFLLEFS